MNKQTIITIVVAVVFLAGGFFGGYKYSQGKSAKPGAAGAARAGGFTGGAGGAARAGGQRFGSGNDFVNGTVLSNDNGTLTIQMRALPGSATSTNSGSKIVILSSNTQIYKAVQGTPADLTVGQSVTATGVDNSSGAMTAQTIQIRQMPPAGQNGQTPPPGQ